MTRARQAAKKRGQGPNITDKNKYEEKVFQAWKSRECSPTEHFGNPELFQAA